MKERRFGGVDQPDWDHERQAIGPLDAMKCFHFSGRDKNARPRTTKSISARSSSSASISMSTSADQDFRRSRSQFNSRDVSDLGAELTTKNSLDVFSRRKSDIREFTFSELKMATKNFSRSLMIGEGGFGGVYRGVIRISEDANKKMDIAVKQMSRRGQQGHKEWVTEVNVLGVVEHPNLVKLMGYCAEDDERGIQHLLVYEYMPNRSVQDHLSLRFQTALPWGTRMKIAQDAARGLAYLHEGMDFQIIFRDFKSSNILLDGQWNAKLSDFGLARLGPSDGFSHVSTAVAGTIGYAAPEYVQTGHLTSKNDVWSYGVFLFELITGRRPVDWNRPKKEQKLLEWVRPHLPDSKKFSMILDPTLEGKYNLRSARKLAAVANQCLARQAKARPKMSEVLEMVNKIVDVTEIGSPPVRPPMKSVASQDAPGISRRKHIKRMFIKPFIREE